MPFFERQATVQWLAAASQATEAYLVTGFDHNTQHAEKRHEKQHLKE
jgi:hypothetical protein